MTLIDSLSAQTSLPLAKRWLRSAPPPLSLSPADKPWRPEPVPEAEGSLSAAAFLEEMDALSRKVVRKEAMNALVTIKPAEIRALVTQIAKTKGRYLAALLETAGQGAGKDGTLGELERLRLRHQELSAGLTQLRAMILEGEIEVEGVGF